VNDSFLDLKVLGFFLFGRFLYFLTLYLLFRLFHFHILTLYTYTILYLVLWLVFDLLENGFVLVHVFREKTRITVPRLRVEEIVYYL